jgi:hypothetical protein
MMFATAKPYFDVKDGQLTLENVPVPPTFLPEQEGELLIALEHSRLAHTVMKRLFPEWWLRAPFERQAQDRENGIKVACGVLHELERLTKLRGSELIVLAQRTEVETPSEATATRGVLSCVTDPATRVLDLQPALSELKAEDPSRYHRLYIPNDGHMTAEGNQFVAREILPVLGER